MATGTRLKWEGRWDQLKGRVKQFWGQLTDDELAEAEGNYDRLIGLIEERSGEQREEIERRLEEGS